MGEPGVTHDVEDFVATVVLRNERRRNAMTLAMWSALADTLEALEPRADVRVLVLRGAGDRAFVSGADISEFETRRSGTDAVAFYDHEVSRAQTTLQRFSRPTVAAIGGICYGGGLGLALACDLRYAAPGSRFRMPAARLGLGYSLEGLRRMREVLGTPSAAELFFTADVLGAEEARRVGLVNGLDDDVFAHAAAVAGRIASNAPLTLRAAKLAFRALGSDERDTRDVERAVAACFTSDDYVEGRRAFAEKRPPRFAGR